MAKFNIGEFVDEIKEGGIRVLLKKFKESVIFRVLASLIVLTIVSIAIFVLMKAAASDEVVKPVYFTLPDVEVLCNKKYFDPENKQEPRRVYIKLRVGIVYKNDPKLQKELENVQVALTGKIQQFIQSADPKEIAYYDLREKEDTGLLAKITKEAKKMVSTPNYIYETFIIQQILLREGATM